MITIKDEYGTTTRVKDLAELTQRYLDCLLVEQSSRGKGNGESPAQVRFTNVIKRNGKTKIKVEIIDDMGRSWQETAIVEAALPILGSTPTWADVVNSIRHCRKVWREFGSDDLSEKFREAMGNVENYFVRKDGKIFRFIEGGQVVPVTVSDPENINVKLRGIVSK